MAVDAKRVEAIFMAAVEADDPADQATLLDRECGSDREMRQRVEALLREHREPATVRTQRIETPNEVDVPSLGRTIAFDALTDPEKPSTISRGTLVRQDEEGRKDDEEPVCLEFLEPTSKPGSLGRLGHHEVVEVLGTGGFGIVMRAFDESLHRMVAIKVLSPQLASTSPAQAISARGPRLRPHPAQ